MRSVFSQLFGIALIGLLGACASPAPAPDVGVDTAGSGESTSPVPFPGQTKYLLGQGDRIAIQVFDEPDLTMEASVGERGSINYSYLGDVRVAGKTPQELEQHIAELLRNGFLVNPAVNVTVLEYRPFYIGGEVRSPGSYPYQPGLTLDKAIALAGGLTDRASTRRMFIVKAGSTDGQQHKAVMSAAVSPGDIISIKEGFF